MLMTLAMTGLVAPAVLFLFGGYRLTKNVTMLIVGPAHE